MIITYKFNDFLIIFSWKVERRKMIREKKSLLDEYVCE